MKQLYKIIKISQLWSTNQALLLFPWAAPDTKSHIAINSPQDLAPMTLYRTFRAASREIQLLLRAIGSNSMAPLCQGRVLILTPVY